MKDYPPILFLLMLQTAKRRQQLIKPFQLPITYKLCHDWHFRMSFTPHHSHIDWGEVTMIPDDIEDDLNMYHWINEGAYPQIILDRVQAYKITQFDSLHRRYKEGFIALDSKYKNL